VSKRNVPDAMSGIAAAIEAMFIIASVAVAAVVVAVVATVGFGLYLGARALGWIG